MAFDIEGLDWFERQWRKVSKGESEVAENRKLKAEKRNKNGVMLLIVLFVIGTGKYI